MTLMDPKHRTGLAAVLHRADAPHRLEVDRRGRFVAREVVGEAVLDGGVSGDLDARVELFCGLGEGVGGVVTDELQHFRARVSGRNDLDCGVLGDGARQVTEVTVEADGGRSLGEAGRDRGCDIVTGDRAGKG